METFLREAKGTQYRFYPIWVMVLYTGMRSGELYALKWSDVDFEAKTISVSRSWSSKNGYTSIRFHELRANFITNLHAQGEPLVRVMVTVGHADMETTNVYLRKAGIEIQGATERLGYRIPKEGGAQIQAFPTESAQTT